MNKSRNRIYTNGEITIFWRASDCIHATICFSELRSVFNPQKRPWVDPNGAPTDSILRVIERCPTQALTFRWNDESRNENETSKKLFTGNIEDHFDKPKSSFTTLSLRPNGPIIAEGEFEVTDEDGNLLKKAQMMSICRCGKSKNQPFCDGTHFVVGFRD